MPKNVEYQISLKDLLSGKIQKAEGHVNHFEHTLEHTTDLTKELMGAAVGFFGLYQGVEFIKSSVEAYNNVEKSLSQLRAGLESTHGAAGVTYEELTEGAEKFAASTIYNKETLLDMQAQLLSFPEITKENFEDAEQAIMDLATRTGHSLHDVSIMVGKALGDPTKGITALRRVGVEFSESQTEVIKKLAETGHVARAQQLILKELGREYAGSTTAASKTAGGQLEILKHQFDEVKESVGKLVMEETVKLAPTIKELVVDFKNIVEWVDKHKEGIIETTKVVGEITVAMWAFGKTKSAIEGLIGAWTVLKGVAKSAGEVMATTSVAGGGAVVGAEAAAGGATGAATSEVAIATLMGSAAVVSSSIALAATIIGSPLFSKTVRDYIYDSSQKGNKSQQLDPDSTSNILKAEISAYDAQIQQNGKTNISDLGGLKDITSLAGLKIADEDLEKYEKQFSDNISKYNKNTGENVSTDIMPNLVSAFKGEDHISADDILHYLKKYEPAEKIKAKTAAAISDAQSSVTGQTVKNIYVTINGGLVHEFNVRTGSIKEAAPDIKRIVTGALTDAINDSEVNN